MRRPQKRSESDSSGLIADSSGRERGGVCGHGRSSGSCGKDSVASGESSMAIAVSALTAVLAHGIVGHEIEQKKEEEVWSQKRNGELGWCTSGAS